MRISNRGRQPSLGFVIGTCDKVDDLTCCLSHRTCRGSLYGPCLVDGQKQSTAAAPVPAEWWYGFVNVGWQGLPWTGLQHGRVKGNAPRESAAQDHNLSEIVGHGGPRRLLVAATTKTACRVELARARSSETKKLWSFGWVRRHHQPHRCGQYRPLAADARERTGLAAEGNTAAFFVARLSGSSLL
jgi:hypothetical protein